MQTQNPFKTVARFAKKAMDPDTQAAVHDVGRMALLSLGAGAAARGGVGLYNMAKRELAPHRVIYPGAVTADLPYPVVDDDKDKDPALKIASDPGLWYTPAMMGTGMAGAYAGWKGIDSLLQSRRKADEDAEVAKAKQDFESAMISSGQPRAKMAADNVAAELSRELDVLFDQVTKSASWKGYVGDYLGAYALPTAALTGIMAYSNQANNSEAAATDKAMQRRARRSYMSRPSEVLVNPRAVSVPPQTDDQDDIQLDREAA